MSGIIFFPGPEKLRKWMEKNHLAEIELWVGFYKKSSGKVSITWPESVDEALCFGWIDGIRKSIDEESYKIRFTPRKKKSIWSAVNIRRATELAKQGRMHPKGLKTFSERDVKNTNRYSFEQKKHGFDPAYEKRFLANKKAWAFFSAQPPYYRKTATWWVMSAKKEETRLKRLGTLMSDSAKGKRVAQLQSPGKKN